MIKIIDRKKKFIKGRYSSDGRGDKPEMFDTKCDECGNPCKVPFKPSGGKPVYCSDCFEKKGGGRKDRRGGDRGRNDRRAGRDSYRDRRPPRGITEEQFEELNSKLDRILKILSNVKPKKVRESKDDEEVEFVEKKIARVKGEKIKIK